MLPGLIAAGMVATAMSSGQVPASAPSGSAGPVLAPAPAYASLFSEAVQRPSPPTFRFEVPGQPLPRRSQPRHKVVCGTTLIIVGSEQDSAMVRPKPDKDTTYTMRRVPPRVCGKDEK